MSTHFNTIKHYGRTETFDIQTSKTSKEVEVDGSAELLINNFSEEWYQTASINVSFFGGSYKCDVKSAITFTQEASAKITMVPNVYHYKEEMTIGWLSSPESIQIIQNNEKLTAVVFRKFGDIEVDIEFKDGLKQPPKTKPKLFQFEYKNLSMSSPQFQITNSFVNHAATPYMMSTKIKAADFDGHTSPLIQHLLFLISRHIEFLMPGEASMIMNLQLPEEPEVNEVVTDILKLLKYEASMNGRGYQSFLDNDKILSSTDAGKKLQAYKQNARVVYSFLAAIPHAVNYSTDSRSNGDTLEITDQIDNVLDNTMDCEDAAFFMRLLAAFVIRTYRKYRNNGLAKEIVKELQPLVRFLLSFPVFAMVMSVGAACIGRTGDTASGHASAGIMPYTKLKNMIAAGQDKWEAYQGQHALYTQELFELDTADLSLYDGVETFPTLPFEGTGYINPLPDDNASKIISDAFAQYKDPNKLFTWERCQAQTRVQDFFTGGYVVCMFTDVFIQSKKMLNFVENFYETNTMNQDYRDNFCPIKLMCMKNEMSDGKLVYGIPVDDFLSDNYYLGFAPPLFLTEKIFIEISLQETPPMDLVADIKEKDDNLSYVRKLMTDYHIPEISAAGIFNEAPELPLNSFPIYANCAYIKDSSKNSIAALVEFTNKLYSRDGLPRNGILGYKIQDILDSYQLVIFVDKAVPDSMKLRGMIGSRLPGSFETDEVVTESRSWATKYKPVEIRVGYAAGIAPGTKRSKSYDTAEQFMNEWKSFGEKILGEDKLFSNCAPGQGVFSLENITVADKKDPVLYISSKNPNIYAIETGNDRTVFIYPPSCHESFLDDVTWIKQDFKKFHLYKQKEILRNELYPLEKAYTALSIEIGGHSILPHPRHDMGLSVYQGSLQLLTERMLIGSFLLTRVEDFIVQ